ncbi:hypothetical protein CEXT_650741 [Caerostris extrusa]|uniref:Uncharacterized protein n=1 Tax=Caerostris extrusa TaxID=172846 RepID=A0AAV4XME8_CAEEX|nr:hypothetical protein CEXT_650741 [Caerostris extrusa]
MARRLTCFPETADQKQEDSPYQQNDVSGKEKRTVRLYNGERLTLIVNKIKIYEEDEFAALHTPRFGPGSVLTTTFIFQDEGDHSSSDDMEYYNEIGQPLTPADFEAGQKSSRYHAFL